MRIPPRLLAAFLIALAAIGVPSRAQDTTGGGSVTITTTAVPTDGLLFAGNDINNFSGVTYLDGGTVNFGQPYPIYKVAAADLSAYNFTSGFNAYSGTLTLNNVDLTTPGGTITVNPDQTATLTLATGGTYTGAITGTVTSPIIDPITGGSLVLSGAVTSGTLILSQNNNAGTITAANLNVLTNTNGLVLGQASIFNGDLTVTNGLTLNISGTGLIKTGTPLLTDGATLTLGSTGALTVPINGTVNLTSAGNLVVTQPGNLVMPQGGVITLTGGTNLATSALQLPVSAALTINMAAGQNLHLLPTIGNLSVTPSAVTFLSGVTSTAGTVSLLYLPAITNLVTNPLELHMSELDNGAHQQFVLQMSFDPATAAALGDLNKLYLAWYDPADGTWKNSVDGNSDGGASAHFVAGAYDPNVDFNLGYYGVDVADSTVWAVVDHNSTFGVANLDVQPEGLPEPSTAALLACGLILSLRRSRKQR